MAVEGVVGGTIRFASRHRGTLTVTRKGTFYELDFPRASFTRQASEDSLIKCVSESPLEFWSTGQDALLVFADSNLIGALSVDFPQLRELKYRALITTSVGNDCDFVSRFFAPSLGINEDAVTGSAHTVLTPFWAERLGKQKLVARQLSQRGGELRCEVVEDRILIGGEAVTYSVGNIIID